MVVAASCHLSLKETVSVGCGSCGSCHLSLALEHLGLADIMQIVRLMSLCASGKMTSTPTSGGEASRLCTTSAASNPAGGVTMIRAGAGAGGGGAGVKSGAEDANVHLQNLTKAIGALVQDNPASLKQLVQLCTQVGGCGCMGVFVGVGVCECVMCVCVVGGCVSAWMYACVCVSV